MGSGFRRLIPGILEHPFAESSVRVLKAIFVDIGASSYAMRSSDRHIANLPRIPDCGSDDF